MAGYSRWSIPGGRGDAVAEGAEPADRNLDDVAGGEEPWRCETDAEPAGVPVTMMSPGSRVIPAEMVAIRSGMSKMTSLTVPDWRAPR